MKKILLLFMIVIIALANCFGCSATGNNNYETPDKEQTETNGGSEEVEDNGPEEDGGEADSQSPTIVPPIKDGGSVDFD